MYHVARKATWELLATAGPCISKVGYQPPLTNLNRLTYITHIIHYEISFTTTTTTLLDMRSANDIFTNNSQINQRSQDAALSYRQVLAQAVNFSYIQSDLGVHFCNLRAPKNGHTNFSSNIFYSLVHN